MQTASLLGNHSQGERTGNGAVPAGEPRWRPIAVDLFCGVGGFSLGFEQAGFDVVASVEYDPVHAATHAFNFPQTEVVCADISKLSPDALRAAVFRGLERHGRVAQKWDGEIDTIFGGPPCQGFSTMGKRLIDDKRNQLVFHFFRIIAELRPRYFVMENVPGMAARGHATILSQLIEEFQGIGYRITLPSRVLNAADFGVPQDRKRLILLGTRQGDCPARYPTPTVRPVPKRERRAEQAVPQRMLFDGGALAVGPTVWDALGDLPDLDGFEELLTSDEARLAPALFERMEQRASAYARRLRGLETDPHDFSHPRAWDSTVLTSSTRTVHTQESIARFRDTKPGETEPISRFYRLDPEGLSNTLRAGTGSERGAYTSPRPIHPTLPRVISVREAARLHSFPDWFRLHGTKWHGFRQIGNAVPPLLGRAVALEIARALSVRPGLPTEPIALGSRDLLSLTMSGAAALFGAKRDAIPAPRIRLAGAP